MILQLYNRYTLKLIRKKFAFTMKNYHLIDLDQTSNHSIL